MQQLLTVADKIKQAYLLSALAKRTASNSGLGVSSAKSEGTLQIHALSLSQFLFSFMKGVTIYPQQEK